MQRTIRGEKMMKKAKVIVLSGQSNAVGVGHVKYLQKSYTEAKINEYFDGYKNIKINYCSQNKMSDGFTMTTKGCTEANKDTIGPEIGMAEYLNSKFPGEEYYIVKFAVGGVSLKYDFLSPSNGGNYDVCEFDKRYLSLVDAFLEKKFVETGWCYSGLASILKDSIEYLKSEGMNPEIIGFCWMQGESDASTLEDVNNYKIYFDGFINDFKNQFAQYLENCVFVDAGISERWNCYKEMNAFKKEYAQMHDKFIYLDTIANGLTTIYEPVEEPDTAHYDCKSVIDLGRLFVERICGN